MLFRSLREGNPGSAVVLAIVCTAAESWTLGRHLITLALRIPNEALANQIRGFTFLLPAALALPLLELLGYQPGTRSAGGLQALTLAYAVLPCALKLLAALWLYRAFVRTPRAALSLHPLKEHP